MIYVPERDVIGFSRKDNLPIVKNKCPVDGKTTREDIKNMVKEFALKYDHFEERTFNAIKRSNLEGWKVEN